jgi:hypothetical protein
MTTNFSSPFYHCNNCKQIINDVEKLLFVEENSTRGFCCELCIENYFQKHIKYYETIEREFRTKHDLGAEPALKFLDEEDVMSQLLSRPDEIWNLKNYLNEEIFSYISELTTSKGEKYFAVALLFLFNKAPSFIFLLSATQSLKLKKEFEIGEMITDPIEFLKEAPAKIDAESDENERQLIESLEQKKSQILATLIEAQKDDDIPTEDYTQYDEFLTPTLESPEEVYQVNDDLGDILYTYIKSHEKDKRLFYYIIVCLVVSQDHENELESIIPIISFPTIDGNVYNIFQKGMRITGPLKS